MCRLLCVRSAGPPFAMSEHLVALAGIAKTSKEYQGHGWGCAWLESGKWHTYHNIRPIWEDELSRFGDTTVLLAHARSAFRDEGICVDNNMPFFDGEYVFIFNGELRGVRIREQGRIGAEKIFNYVKRFDHGDMLSGLNKAVEVITNRSRYIRALNFIMSSSSAIYVVSQFGEDPDYFQLYRCNEMGLDIVCSQQYTSRGVWRPIDNGAVLRL